MDIFDRKASRNAQPTDAMASLQESIRDRGQAQIPEAGGVVDSFARQILARAGAVNNDRARLWVIGRIRFFIVTVLSPQLLEFLKGLPEFPQLDAEYRVLVSNPDRFGAAHLVAWWWHLQPSLFKPFLQGQFNQMEGALVDGTRSILANGGDFTSQLIDWNDFFRG